MVELTADHEFCHWEQYHRSLNGIFFFEKGGKDNDYLTISRNYYNVL